MGAFVGRSVEVASVRRACAAALDDRRPTVALVVGEPGSGKSRLLTEAVAGTDATRITCAGYASERDIPLAAVRNMLRSLAATPNGGPIERLAFSGPDHGRGVEPLRLFEATHRALGDLGPAELLFDDLHWADEASVALVHFLLRAADGAGQQLALVAASRPSSRASAAGDAFTRLLGRDRVVRVWLGPIARADGVLLAHELAPALDEKAAAALWERAQGSPFWVELLARSEHPARDISRVVADRVSAGGRDAADLFALLCVLGRPAPVRDLGDVLGWPVGRAEAAAAALEQHALVRVDRGAVATIHDLLRQAGTEALVPEHERRLHRALADWLGDAGDDEQTMSEALEHAHAAGRQPVELALRLARGPRRRQLGHAGHARLAAIADAATPRRPHVLELRAAVAALASELGDYGDARRRWAELATALDGVEAAWASLRAAQAAFVDRPSDVPGLLARAGRDGADDAALRIEVLTLTALLYRFVERRPEAAQLAVTAAREMTREVTGIDGEHELTHRSADAVHRTLEATIDLALYDDDPVGLLDAADELAARTRDRDEQLYLHGLIQGAMALRALGRNEDAEERAHRAWREARDRVLPRSVLEAGLMWTRVLLSLGRLADAAAVLVQCRALHHRVAGFHPARAFSVVMPALLELTQGDWREGVARLRAASVDESDPHYRLQSPLELAAALARFDAARAADEVRLAVAAARADADAARCVRCAAEADARGAESLARIGDVASASSLLAASSVPAADAYTSLCRLRAEAAVHVAAGGTDGVARWEAVVASAQQQGLRLEAVAARLDLADVLVATDRRRAVEVLRTAGADAERFGARVDQHAAERRLRALGVRTWARGRSSANEPLAGLTTREREIARLVAAGASNPEIAATLFLARKTVERHVSNILAKLGVRNRAELAAVIGEHTDRAEASDPAALTP